jgi:hypothetical protein
MELVSQVAQVALSQLLQALPGIERALLFGPRSLRSLGYGLPALWASSVVQHRTTP